MSYHNAVNMGANGRLGGASGLPCTLQSGRRLCFGTCDLSDWRGIMRRGVEGRGLKGGLGVGGEGWVVGEGGERGGAQDGIYWTMILREL